MLMYSNIISSLVIGIVIFAVVSSFQLSILGLRTLKKKTVSKKYPATKESVERQRGLALTLTGPIGHNRWHMINTHLSLGNPFRGDICSDYSCTWIAAIHLCLGSSKVT